MTMTLRSPMPELEYEHAPCPQCGAADAVAAENICKCAQGMDGDYHCAMDGGKEDLDGRLMFPTQASVDRLNNWFDADAKRLEMDMAHGEDAKR